jgi:hypothetical protein
VLNRVISPRFTRPLGSNTELEPKSNVETRSDQLKSPLWILSEVGERRIACEEARHSSERAGCGDERLLAATVSISQEDPGC